MITTPQAARMLGVTTNRILAMIHAYQDRGPGVGRLRAKKEGRDWKIRPVDLRKVENRRPGRPRKLLSSPLA